MFSSPSPSSSSNNDDDNIRQKSECVTSLSDFNDGLWSGQCTSFSVTSDIAAGVVRPSFAIPYTSTISTRIVEGRQLKLLETLQFHNNNHDLIHVREVPLGIGFDMDSVDGSYSLDCIPYTTTQTSTTITTESTMEENDENVLDAPLRIQSQSCPLPPSILGGFDKSVIFGIEHSIAISDNERIRLFVFYDEDGLLARIGVCQEHRLHSDSDDDDDDDDDNKEEEEEQEEEQSMDDDNTDLDDNDNNMDIINPTRPITAESTKEERMEALKEVLDRAAQRNKNNNDSKSTKTTTKATSLIPQLIDMYTLSLGVWLGDAVIRDHTNKQTMSTTSTSTSFKGFGITSSSKKKLPFGIGFAEWSMGVQKLAMTYKWDFDSNVRHVLDWGRSMGNGISDVMPRSSLGTVDERMAGRRLEKNERILYIDYDLGQYAAFALGSVYIKVPRSLTFSKKSQTHAFYTEFSVFQQNSNNNNNNNDTSNDLLLESSLDFLDEDHVPEIVCSRMTRLYNNGKGTLEQGTTSFFKLQPMPTGE